MPDIIPENIVVDNKDAAADNIRYIDEAIGKWRTQAQAGGQGGRILFPPGKIWIDRAIFLFEEEAGITLEGQGWNQNSQNPSQFDPGPTGNTLILNSSGFGYPDGTVLQVLSRNIGYRDGVTYGNIPTKSVTLPSAVDPANYAVGDCVFLC
jgi:hypothetical protein